MSTIANAKVEHNYNCYNGYFFGCLLSKIFRFFVGNSIIFQLTDRVSTCCCKNLLLGKIKTTGTLRYQTIEFPLMYY